MCESNHGFRVRARPVRIMEFCTRACTRACVPTGAHTHTLYPMLQVIQERMAHRERLVVERTLLLESLKESMGQEVCICLSQLSLAFPAKLPHERTRSEHARKQALVRVHTHTDARGAHACHKRTPSEAVTL